MIVELLAAAATAASGLGPVLVRPGERAAYEAQLSDQAREADALFGGGACREAKVQHVSTEAVKIGDKPDFAAAHERVRVTGCGRSTLENVHVGRFGGSPPWQMSAGLPGASLADMLLQQNAWPAALARAREGLPATCRGASLGEIYVAARPGHVRLDPSGATRPKPAPGMVDLTSTPDIEARRAEFDMKRAWAEVWPFRICGQDRTSLVVFIPLREGDQSLYLFLPVWEQILAHGSGARPRPAPED